MMAMNDAIMRASSGSFFARTPLALANCRSLNGLTWRTDMPAASFRSRQGDGHDRTPVAPHNALFPSYKTARVHHAAWRSGGGMAAGGAGAAAGADAAHRRAHEHGRGRSGRTGPQNGVRTGAAAIRLDRRPQPPHRDSLGHRSRQHPQISG